MKTEESNANKKFKKVRGKEVNEFVKQFIKCVEETARYVYSRILEFNFKHTLLEIMSLLLG